jgi:excisionase family DNA binding protein
MTKSLEIAGKKMLSIRYASECIGYSHDYVTRLAREGKITAAQVGRNWYVDLESVRQYASVMELELKLRQQQLSDERKREQQIRKLAEYQVVKANASGWTQKRYALMAVLAMVGVSTVSGVALKHLTSREAIPANVQAASVEQIREVQGSPIVKNTEGLDAQGNQEHLNFSHESSQLSTLADKSEGVLLLPNISSSTTNAAALFSDEVKIVTDSKTGEQFVALLNDRGEVVEKIPFVVVPVSTKKTP